ncbi:xanthine dehydrogenase family protein subunit M [Aureimonas sp. AU20]|uniref:FAD binding domain-containing protein n=1 Tax=Aureimonas sp. AU20 TaxID=1349819 RepID=UPI00071F2FCA|nr:FAD binding domain-containing protein [Aureimonas sp. AU20]ALN75583.1 hypothetical protein M673_22835 [Aureimonas sp. AU20]
MLDTPQRHVVFAESLDVAIEALAGGASVLAGGTWMMRAERRGEPLPASVVLLDRIPALSEVVVTDTAVTLGAGLTHVAVANALKGLAGLQGIVTAASSAANPAIRHAATLGGNLAASDFAAADLAPALLVQGAEVELAARGGSDRMPLDAFLAERRTRLRSAILVRVHLPREAVASAHARLPLRKAGDYPVAIVSLARLPSGALRVAVGSVEPVARRWTALEAAIGTRLISPDEAARLALAHMDFEGRDGVEADGWYRVTVLPALVKRAMEDLEARA